MPEIYNQYPLKIKVTRYSSWVGPSTFKLLINKISTITYAHHGEDKVIRQILESEQNHLISLVQKIRIPFTGENFIEGIVCDGGGYSLEIKSKDYKLIFSFHDGQDENANKSIIKLVDYIYSLIDLKDQGLSFGSLG